jgi:hypothetical protein
MYTNGNVQLNPPPQLREQGEERKEKGEERRGRRRAKRDKRYERDE